MFNVGLGARGAFRRMAHHMFGSRRTALRLGTTSSSRKELPMHGLPPFIQTFSSAAASLTFTTSCIHADLQKEQRSVEHQNLQLNVQNSNNDHNDLNNRCKEDNKLGQLQNWVQNVYVSLIPTDMSSEFKSLGYGIIASNLAVYTGFSLARYLESLPRPNPSLLKFMISKFVLNRVWMKKTGWPVLLTYQFTHANIPHLMLNSLCTWLFIHSCSKDLDVWQVAGLYFGGGMVGGAASMLVCNYMRLARYQLSVVGGSGGLLALFGFSYAQNVDGRRDRFLSQSRWFHDAFPLALLLREVFGVAVYFRYGAKGKGILSFKANHLTHLTGAALGFAFFLVKKLLFFDRNEGDVDDDALDSYEES